MKYMLLIWNRPGFTDELTEQERTALFAEVGQIMDELTERGELVGGEALADPSVARTTRFVDGRTTLTDGPFVESKEQFAGYVAIDVETHERAEEVAARWPDTRFGGAIELRAVMSGSGEEM